MKRFLLYLLLIPVLSIAQQKAVQCTANYQTFLLSNPTSAFYYPPNLILDTIQNGNIINCYGFLDTTINGRNSKWVRAVYKQKDGYVPVDGLKIKSEDLAQLNAADVSLLRNSAFILAKQSVMKDSIQQASLFRESLEQKIQDSVNNIAYEKSKVETAKYVIKEGIAFVGFDFEETPYHTVNFTAALINYAGKTIKYVWFNVGIANPVRDDIGKKTLRMTGPVYDRAPGSATFDDILYTKEFGFGYVISVRVQYMDGSEKTYSGDKLLRLTINPNAFN